MILIKDGRVVDPKRGIDDVLDLLIEDGKIKKIGKYQRSDDYERIVEAKGLIVAQGMNTMAVSQIWAKDMASCPAPLIMER